MNTYIFSGGGGGGAGGGGETAFLGAIKDKLPFSEGKYQLLKLVK